MLQIVSSEDAGETVILSCSELTAVIFCPGWRNGAKEIKKNLHMAIQKINFYGKATQRLERKPITEDCGLGALVVYCLVNARWTLPISVNSLLIFYWKKMWDESNFSCLDKVLLSNLQSGWKLVFTATFCSKESGKSGPVWNVSPTGDTNPFQKKHHNKHQQTPEHHLQEKYHNVQGLWRSVPEMTHCAYRNRCHRRQ